MNIYCDNYSVCNGMLIDQGDQQKNEQYARAKGWHLFTGHTMGGKEHKAVLCDQCASKRRIPKPPAVLDGQDGLFTAEFTFVEVIP